MSNLAGVNATCQNNLNANNIISNLHIMAALTVSIQFKYSYHTIKLLHINPPKKKICY